MRVPLAHTRRALPPCTVLQCNAVQVTEKTRLSDSVNNGVRNGRAPREMKVGVNKQSHPAKFFS